MLLVVSCYDENETIIFSSYFRSLREAKDYFFQCYDSGLYNHVSLEVTDEDIDE